MGSAIQSEIISEGSKELSNEEHDPAKAPEQKDFYLSPTKKLNFNAEQYMKNFDNAKPISLSMLKSPKRDQNRSTMEALGEITPFGNVYKKKSSGNVFMGATPKVQSPSSFVSPRRETKSVLQNTAFIGPNAYTRNHENSKIYPNMLGA